MQVQNCVCVCIYIDFWADSSGLLKWLTEKDFDFRAAVYFYVNGYNI